MIKVRTCADGSNQRRNLKEVKRISSPMVSFEALFCTLIVNAHEGHDVATFDIHGAYVHAEITKENRILMKLRGYFFEIVCQVNPEYEQDVRYENGKKVSFLLVLRAIYGFIESVLLWYNLFSTILEGFFLNKLL